MNRKDIELFLQKELLKVQKPGRYIGNEQGIRKKDPDTCAVSIALAFPDIYEIGMSYLGYQILYHILNKKPYVRAERVYAPWMDFEQLLRAQNIPLFSLETKSPLSGFDLIGFSLQYEMHYTNILNMLELGKVPQFSTSRDENDPIVIAGGPCAYNPEPLAEFIDAFVIGDGEEVFVELAETVNGLKKRNACRRERLETICKIPGVYVPAFYEPEYDRYGKFTGFSKNFPDAPDQIETRLTKQLKPEHYPDSPIVPVIDITHNRLSLEIMRGCTQGCRFCNAGYIYRPVRERPVPDLIRQTKTTLEKAGFDELSLMSLSTSDYSELIPLMNTLGTTLENSNVSFSFPSLRSDAFTQEMADFAKSRRKSGLTFAPEAGTERLRNVINKNISEDGFYSSVKTAASNGWRLIKLYFMIGFPSETEEDLDGIVHMVRKITAIGNKYKGLNINLSLSPFSPKPFTPFQWFGANSVDMFNQKMRYLKNAIKMKNLKIKWREPELAFLETIVARGDRRIGRVIYTAWEQGAKFDGWSDYFRYDRWMMAFEMCGISPDRIAQGFATDAALPWDHINKQVSKKYLLREWEKAQKGQPTFDCRSGKCANCGLMKSARCYDILKTEDVEKIVAQPLRKKKSDPDGAVFWYLFFFTKNETMRFTSHLDTVKIFERAFSIAETPLAYSQGFHAHPKMTFSPPLALGYTSGTEYLLAGMQNEIECNTVKEAVNAVLPDGFTILKTIPVNKKDWKWLNTDYIVTYEISSLNDDIAIQLREKTQNIRHSYPQNNKNITKLEFLNNTLVIQLRAFNGKIPRCENILKTEYDLDENSIQELLIHKAAFTQAN